ncbi:hypothetical protein BKA70DRAFT_1440893 [Coprinopsis sp. MPI-PUGE-AT-0042]|nr:hypothetical protein BKA70DRAFT_1440893 [Coprinopsis sp. MPI-PUGE-AT-0042]
MLQLPTEPKNLMTWSSLGQFIEMAYPLTYNGNVVKPIELSAYRLATTFTYPLCRHMTEAKLLVDETIEHAVFTCSHDLSCTFHFDIYGLLSRRDNGFYAEVYPMASNMTHFYEEDYVMEDDSSEGSSGLSSTQFSIVESETESLDSFIVSDTSEISIHTTDSDLMPPLIVLSDSSESSSQDCDDSSLSSFEDEQDGGLQATAADPNILPVVASHNPVDMLEQLDDDIPREIAHRLAVLRLSRSRYIRRVVLTDSGDSSSDS